MTSDLDSFTISEKEGLYKAVFSRRDVRSHFIDKDSERQDKYVKLKLEGILESNINICVTYDPEKFGPFVLGRTSIPETGEYSVCCAIQNLWLAARAEGIGVGWVSILSVEDLRKILVIPNHVKNWNNTEENIWNDTNMIIQRLNDGPEK